MSYRFKGEKVILEGNRNIFRPKPLPSNPENGTFCVDDADSKAKVYDSNKERWIIIGDAVDIYFDNTENNFNSNNIQGAIEEAKYKMGEYNYNYSESLSSTTSTNYQNKVNLSLTDIPSGDYHIGWYYEWRTCKQNLSIKIRVQLDNDIDLSRTEPSPNRNYITHSASGFKKISLNGNHVIDLDFASEYSGKAVYIGRARLELWRVS